MSTKSNKSSIKKLLSLGGIASASVFLCLPAFATIDSHVRDSAQFSNDRTYQTDSTVSSKELLAQTSPGQEPVSPGETEEKPSGSESVPTMPSSPDGGGTMTSPSSPEGGSDATTSPSSPRPSENTAPPPASGSSSDEQAASSSQRKLERGSWFCMNNPNPQCR